MPEPLPLTVLVAGPDEALRADLSGALSAAGFETETGALPAAFAEQPASADAPTPHADFAVLDLSQTPLPSPLPPLPLIADALDDSASPAIPFVAIVDRAGAGAVHHALRRGAIACFSKPIDAPLIAQSIPTWVGRAAESERRARRTESLEAALAVSRQLGTAVGMLSARHTISVAQAFDLLRRRARHTRRRVDEVALAIVAGTETF